MNGSTVSSCDYARDRHRNIARWRNLWSILLFIFGATVILFLCVAVILFINASWLPGAVTVLGTLVNGAGVRWVYDRRNEAVREETEAYQDVLRQCGGKSAAATAGSVDEFQRWKLFGLFR